MNLKRSALFLTLAGLVVGTSAYAQNQTQAANPAVANKAEATQKMTAEQKVEAEKKGKAIKTAIRHAKKHHAMAPEHVKMLLKHEKMLKQHQKALAWKGGDAADQTDYLNHVHGLAHQADQSANKANTRLSNMLNGITVSGGLNVEGAFNQPKDTKDSTNRTFSVDNSYLNFKGVDQADANLSGVLTLLYGTKENGNTVATNGAVGSNKSKVSVNQAFVKYNNIFNATGFYAQAGQMYMPFGSYLESHGYGVQDTLVPQLTQSLTQVNDVAVQGGYANQGFTADVYGFQNAANTSSGRRAANFGLDVGYAGNIGNNGVKYETDLGYLHNLQSLDALQGASVGTNSDRVSALSLFGKVTVPVSGNTLDASVHAVRTLDSKAAFIAQKITAFDTTVGFRFPVSGHSSRAYVGYGHVSNVDSIKASNFSLPQSQTSVGYDFNVTNNATLGLAYAHQKFAAAGAPAVNLVLTRAAINFG